MAPSVKADSTVMPSGNDPRPISSPFSKRGLPRSLASPGKSFQGVPEEIGLPDYGAKEISEGLKKKIIKDRLVDLLHRSKIE